MNRLTQESKGSIIKFIEENPELVAKIVGEVIEKAENQEDSDFSKRTRYDEFLNQKIGYFLIDLGLKPHKDYFEYIQKALLICYILDKRKPIKLEYIYNEIARVVGKDKRSVKRRVEIGIREIYKRGNEKLLNEVSGGKKIKRVRPNKFLYLATKYLKAKI